MAVGDELEFSDVYLLERGAQKTGRLKLHKTGVVFRCTKTGKVTQVNSSDVQDCSWMKVARGYGLKVILNAGTHFSFNGFKETDFSLLSDFLSKNFKINLAEVELSVKGWNWGTAKFRGSTLSFEVDEKPAFEIPLQDVSQAITGKHEVTLEFHQNDDADVSLMEMRFFVPTPVDSTDADPAKTFQEQVLSKADIIQAVGDAIVTFPEVACLTPRGRYNMKVYPSFVQLHGKTYDYKIPYSTILRLFLLPHKDNRSMYFVVTMDPPIKQGQTRYPFLILQFMKDEDMDVHLNVTEEEIKEKYDGKLTKEMSAPSYEIMSRVMKAVVGRKITVPGSFKSHMGYSCITSSYKAGSGFLYPLERGFIFVHKPPVHVRFDEVSSVNFARVAGGGGSSKSFDFEIETKSGTLYTFSNIEKEEYGKLFDFVASKNLRIKNKGVKSHVQKNQEDWGSDDDEHDAYLEQIKADAADSDSSESDDESDDEEFKPESGDEQHVKEEYDSNVSSSSGESDQEGGGSGSDDDKKKKKKKKVEKEKKERKRKKSSEDGESPKKKAKARKSEGGPSKKKAKKDPDAPKRALSAYMLWLSETRQTIKDENPGISITEITKVAGQKWKALQDKSKWEAMAAEQKKEYQKKMVAYNASKKDNPSSSPASSKKKEKSVKDYMKKEKTTTSPRKGLYTSAEFVDTDDSSSDEEKPKAKKSKEKPPPKAKAPKKKKEESESDEEPPAASSEEEEEEMSEGSDSD